MSFVNNNNNYKTDYTYPSFPHPMDPRINCCPYYYYDTKKPATEEYQEPSIDNIKNHVYDIIKNKLKIIPEEYILRIYTCRDLFPPIRDYFLTQFLYTQYGTVKLFISTGIAYARIRLTSEILYELPASDIWRSNIVIHIENFI